MKYVIIGVGAAGITAAKTLRECDPAGEILMISADQHVHSRCMLHKYISGERTEKELDFTEEGFFDKYRIAWISGVRAETVDTKGKAVILNSKERIRYDKLLIATGSNSFIPPVGDFRKAKNVIGLRHLSDAQGIVKTAEQAEKVLIVGSGLVGLDAAYGLMELGKEITVVEMAPQILPVQLDEHAAKEYQTRFEQAGCKFLLGRKADQAVCNTEGIINQVTLDDGETIPCDLIVAAAGVRPAIELLTETELAFDRGITVDDTMQTSVEDIYAAGDVAGLSGIWPNAMKQGKVAAKNMCGIHTVYDDTYAVKNTINFFGLLSLCIGKIRPEEGDQIEIQEDSKNYKRVILKNGLVEGVLLQGDISSAGIWQYLIKNRVGIKDRRKSVFQIHYADYYHVGERGMYEY